VRPLGIFGGFHSSSIFVLLSFLTYITMNYIVGLKRNIYWLLLIIYIICMNSGQTIILAITAYFLDINLFKKTYFTKKLVFFGIFIPIFIFWVSNVGHLADNPLSMDYIVLESLKFFTLFPDSSCFIMGCSLNGAEIHLLASDSIGFKPVVPYTDSGYIAALLSLGAGFMIVYFAFCLSINKLSINHLYRKSLFILSFTVGATVIHYPVGFGSSIYALYLMSFYVIYHVARRHSFINHPT
jgi:hypothetical protein